MTSQAKWDPLKELTTVKTRMNKLFESAMGMADFDAHEGPATWTPVCDAYETPESLVVCLELPGLQQSQIDLRVDGDELVVSGERELSREQSDEQFLRVERPYGKFLRRFHLPSTVDREAIEASFRDGLLQVTLPSRHDRQPGPIQVEIQ